MVVDSMQPHFVGVDPDILSTGLVFFYLKVMAIGIGSCDMSCDVLVFLGGLYYNRSQD